MRNLGLAALIAASCSLAGCVDVAPVVTDCPVWPQEGDAAYGEIQNACGGEAMPNCPAHKEWRSRLRNLKLQLDACAPKELS